MDESLPAAGGPDAARDVLARRYPNAEVRWSEISDERGHHQRWMFLLQASSPGGLEDQLAAAACAVPASRRIPRSLPEWARELAQSRPDYDFRPYGICGGYAVGAQRVGDGAGPWLVITNREDEMCQALGEPSAEMRVR